MKYTNGKKLFTCISLNQAFNEGKLLEFWQNASEVVSYFYEYIIWLPFNIIIMGDKSRLQSWVFYLSTTGLDI